MKQLLQLVSHDFESGAVPLSYAAITLFQMLDSVPAGRFSSLDETFSVHSTVMRGTRNHLCCESGILRKCGTQTLGT